MYTEHLNTNPCFIVLTNPESSTRLSIVEDELIDNILLNKQFELKVKLMIENSIVNALLKTSKNTPGLIDNPFDAIYLADLQPDTISDSIVMKLSNFSTLEDRSDMIHFADGWDD